MQLLGPLVRRWQRAPVSWRRGVVTSPIAPILRRVLNRFYPQGPRIFALAAPLAGRQMRLHWQSHKAYVFGTYEPAVIRAIQQHVLPGWTVLDAGAHIGYYTLLLAELVGPEGKVIAFEASPEIFAVLKENIHLNRCGNVVLENRAVAGSPRRLALRRNDAYPLSATSSIHSGRAAVEVEAVALDQFLGSGFDRVAFIKMDVEGAEAEALQGLRELLRRDHPLLLIEIHGFDVYKEQHPALCELKEIGYEARYLDGPAPEVHILAEFRPQQSHELVAR